MRCCCGPCPLPTRTASCRSRRRTTRLNLPTFSASVPNFVSWREQARSFEEFAAIGFNNYTLTGNGEPEQLSGNRISPAVMRVLGLAPVVEYLADGSNAVGLGNAESAACYFPAGSRCRVSSVTDSTFSRE